MATPDELCTQLDMDDATLKALAARGDEPSQEHKVEHHFYGPAKEPFAELAALGRKLGFGSSAIDQSETDDGSAYFYMDLLSATILEPTSVYRESVLMKLLGETYGVEYDGWGTLVKKA